MTAQLLFCHRMIPRTTTRQQWREIDRWRRQTQRAINQSVAETQEAIRHLGAYGHTTIAVRLAEGLVNPPLIIYPEPK